MSALRIVGAAALVPPGIGVGMFVNLLVDRVPLRRPLLPLDAWPRRCPLVELPPLPRHPNDPPEEDELLDIDETETADPAGPVVAVSARIPYEQVAHHGAPTQGRPLQRRCCPECGTRASVRYPVVEILVAILFSAAALRFGAAWVLPAYLVFFTCLVAVSVIDLDYHIIPNRIVYPTIFASIPLLTLAAAAGHDFDGLREALIGASGAWCALLVIHLISPRGMGFGDVRLAFILGLFLGWITLDHVLTGIFMGFVLGAVIGVGLILVGRKGRRDAIPFGPFLAAGATLVVFIGGPVIRWWLG